MFFKLTKNVIKSTTRHGSQIIIDPQTLKVVFGVEVHGQVEKSKVQLRVARGDNIATKNP